MHHIHLLVKCDCVDLYILTKLGKKIMLLICQFLCVVSVYYDQFNHDVVSYFLCI